MRYQCIRQHSQEDCGAACLAAISKYYGKDITLNRSREIVGTGQRGTSLLGLKRGAVTLGFNTHIVRASPEILEKIKEVPLPAIIHWQDYHWVVLYGKKKNKYVIADPGVGVRYLSAKELSQGWLDWMMLLLEPDSNRFVEQKSDITTGFKSFLSRVINYKHLLIQALAINFILGLLSLASPFLLQILTDDVLVRGDSRLLGNMAIAVIIMTLISTTLSLVQSNLIAHFAKRLELGLVKDFARKLLDLPLSYYEARRSGEIISRLGDIQQINQLVSQVVIGLPSQFFVAIISLALMFFYTWKLSLVAIAICLFMTISAFLFQPTLQQKTQSLLVTEAETQGILVETFKGAITLKTTTATSQFWWEFQSRFNHLANLGLKTIQIGIINHNFANLVSSIGSITLLWIGGNLVIEPVNNLSIGQLLAFKAMNDNFVAFIATLVNFVDEFTRAKTATQRLGEVIDATPETKNETDKAWVNLSYSTDIICDRLSFHHSGRIDLLEDFNLTIPGGKVIALIGKSGCGKSTLAKLISGLYNYQSGNIRFGNYNQQDLARNCLRQQVKLVPQEAHFWSRSIIDNFRLGNSDVNFEEIVTACKISGADEFISKLPDKYLTVLGEFGSNLSGGQRQKLAIARAIINDPPILILDESTSALDPISEADVLNTLLKHRQGKTTILISHRPKVIQRADLIVLLEAGKVSLQGLTKDLYYQSGQHLDFIIN
ncbi:MAG: peptidase domain-containing ABC transporter [Pleurocapsa sp. MO_192.B19]|nr:peptidase domain-containing ABC transporter [Pleurocapsa sp. MO_192.B19]